MQQELCLESMPGAGAHYMHNYDEMHPAVRERLRESSLNICMECLCLAVENREQRKRWDCNPHTFICTIEDFETGAINDYRERLRKSEQSRAEDRLRQLYGATNYPPAYFNDPSWRTPRRFDYPSSRELQYRMESREWEYRPDFSKGYDRPPKELMIDWIMPTAKIDYNDKTKRKP